MAVATMASLSMLPTTTTTILALITLAVPRTRIRRWDGGRTMTRKMAAATDEAVTPISTVRKRWDTTTPSAWR
jgi:hypothetical protein